jgi:hypothetical protein
MIKEAIREKRLAIFKLHQEIEALMQVENKSNEEIEEKKWIRTKE